MRYISTLLVAGFLAATGPAMAQDLPDPDSPAYRELPLMIEETGTIYQKIIVRKVETKPEGTKDTSLQSHYSLSFTLGEEGYIVTKKLEKFKILSSDDAGLNDPRGEALINQIAASMSDVVYLGDESLTPQRIENWPQLQNTIKATMTAALKGTEGGEKIVTLMMDTIYGRLTPETAASALLQADALIAMPHNLGLEVNKPLSMDSQVIVPIGNYPLDASETLILTHYDESANTARITYDYAPKPESLAGFMTDFLPKFITQMGAPADVVAQMSESMKNEDPSKFVTLKTHCDYELAIDTGLVRKGLCTKLAKFNLAGQVATKEESWEFSESFTPFN